MKIYKVYCECCGVVTPQIDNTCTWRCQRCFSANSFSNLADGEWTGEELKAFYEQYPQNWNMSAIRIPVTAVGVAFNINSIDVALAANGYLSGYSSKKLAKKEKKFISFKEVHDTGKTKVFDVINTAGDALGKICWYPNWRRYTFWPVKNTIFDNKCLNDISEFIEDLMEKRKGVPDPATI